MMKLIRRLIAWPNRRLLFQVLVGRNRSREVEDGRFEHNDVRDLLERSERIAGELMSSVPHEKTMGARMMVKTGAMTMALFRAMREQGIEAGYAIELCTDYMWQGYKRRVALPRIVARLTSRDPQTQMDRIQRFFLGYPLASPGYECHAVEGESCASYDIRRCPVNDYFATQDEEAQQFFRNSWCTLDWPLAEHLVEGGSYERRRTLSHGDSVCDMRWRVRPR